MIISYFLLLCNPRSAEYRETQIADTTLAPRRKGGTMRNHTKASLLQTNKFHRSAVQTVRRVRRLRRSVAKHLEK